MPWFSVKDLLAKERKMADRFDIEGMSRMRQDCGYHKIEIKGDNMPKVKPNIHTLIFRLHELGCALTGSRAFGTDRPTSDWDFFCDEETMHQIVKEFPGQFELVVSSTKGSDLQDLESYKDLNTAYVYYHKYFRDKLHIQVSKDPTLKMLAQKLLMSMPEQVMSSMIKAHRRHLWNWAFEQVNK